MSKKHKALSKKDKAKIRRKVLAAVALESIHFRELPKKDLLRQLNKWLRQINHF